MRRPTRVLLSERSRPDTEEYCVLSKKALHHAPPKRRAKPYDPLRPVGSAKHKPRGWFARLIYNPWVLTIGMGVIALSTVAGVYLSTSGALNQSTVSSQVHNSADTVDQTAATASPTSAAAAGPSPTPGPVRAYATPPAMAIDPSKQYTATVNTSKGSFQIQLFAKDAPQTVNSFVFLAEHHFFDGLTFNRVVPGFVIQGGDPNGDGTGGPGYKLPDEINSHKNVAGSVAMANAGPGTDGSQFYINLADNTSLDGKYTVFGQVTNGMDVVQTIGKTARDPSQTNAPAVTINSITIATG